MKRSVTMTVWAKVPGDDPSPATREAEAQAEQAVTSYSARIEQLVHEHTGSGFSGTPESWQDKPTLFNKHPNRKFVYGFEVEIPGDNGYKDTEKAVRSYLDDLGDKIITIRGTDKDVTFDSKAL